MKDFIKGIIEANGEQWIGFIMICLLMSLATIGITALTADHKVRCNYLRMETGSAITTYSILNDIDWAEDTRAFVSAEKDEVLEVFATVNQCKGE